MERFILRLVQYLVILMLAEKPLLRLNDIHRDIAAVIGDTLIICQQIIEDKSCLQRALLAADALNMVVLDLIAQIVDHFFERINLKRDKIIIINKSFDRHLGDIRDRLFQNLQLFLCPL